MKTAAPTTTSLQASAEELSDFTPSMPAPSNGGTFSRSIKRLVYGRESSLSQTVLEPGYRSLPHAHGSERLAYVVSGEVSLFMDAYEYRLDAGDFINVPAMMAHWTWNRSGEPCVVMTCSCPASVAPEGRALFAESERVDGLHADDTIRLSNRYTADEHAMPRAPEDSPWLGRADRVKSGLHRQMQSAGRLESRFVYGERSNLMVATRAPGYHSTPHVHDCEQLNFLLGGSLWIFVENTGYFLLPGDFFRVPRMAAHWAWNDSVDDCTLVESHSPVLDPASKDAAVPLLPAERIPFVQVVRNLFVPERLADGEAEMMAAYAGRG